jgi:PAS domain S-box-containing protein
METEEVNQKLSEPDCAKTKSRPQKNELKKSEERYKILLESTPLGIYYNDFSGRFLYGNPRAEEIIGYKKEELIGKNFLKLKILPVGQIKKAAKLLALNRMGRSTGPDEFTLKRKDGSKRHVEVTTQMIVLDGKKVVMGLVQDVSDRIRVEMKLKESEEQYRSLFEGSPDAVFLADPKTGKIIDANPAASHLLLRSRKEMIGMHQSELHPPRLEAYAKEKFDLHARQTGAPIAVESVVLRSDGEEVPVEVLAQKTVIAGRPILQGIFRNIKERKRAEEQIKTSLREKEVLLRELHHRVKNNVQVMASLLRLQTGHIKNKKMQDMINSYLGRIQSMGIIHEKLYQSEDLARINLSHYIRSLATHLFHTYGVNTNAVKLRVEMEDVHLDINRAIPLGLIINEIVSNSLKHAFPLSKKGEVFISLQSTDEANAVLKIIDTGIGIPKEIDSKNPQSLGLQLVNDLVKQIGGRFELTREKGTVFKITF